MTDFDRIEEQRERADGLAYEEWRDRTRETDPEWFVQFTNVGWQVRSSETGDEAPKTFGSGKEEYARAKEYAKELNAQ